MYWLFSNPRSFSSKCQNHCSMVFTPLLCDCVFLLNYSPKPNVGKTTTEYHQWTPSFIDLNTVCLNKFWEKFESSKKLGLPYPKLGGTPCMIYIYGKICDILWKLEESSSILHIVRFLWLWWWLSPVAWQSTYASTFGKNRPAAAAKSKRGEMRKPSSRQLFNFKGDNIGG